jgi:hypothetical protein
VGGVVQCGAAHASARLFLPSPAGPAPAAMPSFPKSPGLSSVAKVGGGVVARAGFAPSQVSHGQTGWQGRAIYKHLSSHVNSAARPGAVPVGCNRGRYRCGLVGINAAAGLNFGFNGAEDAFFQDFFVRRRNE